MKHVSLQLTEDGSHTLFNAELNETYHSHKGALAESRYVFIHAGLEQVLQDFDHLAILEVGFGTGSMPHDPGEGAGAGKGASAEWLGAAAGALCHHRALSLVRRAD